MILLILLILPSLCAILIEYSDIYSDTSGSIWSFKRDNIFINADATNDDNAPLFKCKASLITNTEVDGAKV